VHLGDFSFASIADEKVVRVFEASQPFVKVMKQLGAFEGVDEVGRTRFEENVFDAILPSRAIVHLRLSFLLLDFRIKQLAAVSWYKAIP
jgi:hypothetical protein